MRIAHVAGSKTPENIQGNERHIVDLAGAQRARGLTADVVTNCNGLFFKLCAQDGIPAFVVDDLLSSGEVAPGAGGFAQGIVAMLKSLNPDIVHCHDLLTAGVAVAAANRIKVPCVITLHTGIRPMIYDLIAAKRLTVILVCKSEFDAVRKSGGINIDFHYVPYGIRALSGAYRQEQELSTPCRPNLMLVANLGHRKGIDLAILAMVELRRRRGSDCPVLNIYGAGDLGEYFVEMARMLRLDDIVKFHGIQMDIIHKCPSSDVLIVASRAETGPLVVLEAMSRGMPTVASDVGDVSEMLPDWRFGRVVPVNSITALADAVDSMLTDITSGRFDPALLVDRYRSQYSIEKMANRVDAVYQSAVRGG
jgi:glycosyltransferase involved in cell wall biosynthesis